MPSDRGLDRKSDDDAQCATVAVDRALQSARPGTRRDRAGYLVQSFALTFISRPRPTGSGTGSPVHNVACSAGYVLATQCVQRRLACSVGGSPTGARVRSPVAWVATVEETKRM